MSGGRLSSGPTGEVTQDSKSKTKVRFESGLGTQAIPIIFVWAARFQKPHMGLMKPANRM